MDTVTEHSIQEALSALGHNRTVMIIAHRLSTIRQANQIIVLDKGCVVERGTHEELLKINHGYYARLWNMQLRSNSNDGNGDGNVVIDGDGGSDGIMNVESTIL